jgi:hypothetical protein
MENTQALLQLISLTLVLYAPTQALEQLSHLRRRANAQGICLALQQQEVTCLDVQLRVQ